MPLPLAPERPPPVSADNTLTVDWQRWIPRLFGIIAVLGVLDVLALVSTYYFGRSQVLGLVPLFRLDFEKNIPTLFSAFLLLACAAVAGLRAHQITGRGESRAWTGIALISMLVAFDEYFSVHEMFTAPLRRSFGTSGLFHFAWVIPYGLVAIGLVLWYLPFLLRLPRTFQRELAVAGLIYVGGGIGMEMVGGAYLNGMTGRRDFTFGMLTTVEELMEMVGVTLGLRALLRGCEVRAVHVAVQFARRA